MTSEMTQQLWKQFYNRIKDPLWPELNYIDEFKNLPQWIQDEILYKHHGNNWFCLNSNEDIIDFTELYYGATDTESQVDLSWNFNMQVQIKDITVHYRQNLNGGGDTFGQDFPDALRFLYGDYCFDCCLEWCAGPGFIGFSILAENLCNTLYLNDMFEPAIQACKKTINELPLKYQDRVKTIHTGSVEDFPNDVVFDLVVGNPPHFANLNFMLVDQPTSSIDFRREVDKNWDIHKNFFYHIDRYLKPNGKILLVENVNGMSPWDLENLMDHSRFKITRCFRVKKNPLFWYCEILKI